MSVCRVCSDPCGRPGWCCTSCRDFEWEYLTICELAGEVEANAFADRWHPRRESEAA